MDVDGIDMTVWIWPYDVDGMYEKDSIHMMVWHRRYG